MRKAILPLVLVIICCFSCKQESSLDDLKYSSFDTLQFKETTSIRGLHVLNDSVIWLSGNKGFFARSINGGKTWNSGVVAFDSLMDFRDIHVFSANEAMVMSAGSPARFYKTMDGGSSWTLVYENTHPSIFFDSFEFWDANTGIACGDPIEGIFQILISKDAGNSWKQIDAELLPEALKVEGGFAASGSCIALAKDGLAMFALGGSKTRILRTENFGESWEAVETPFISGEAGFGIYSIEQINENDYVAVGGHWQKNDEAKQNFIISHDKGKTWKLGESMPSGFRSCIKYDKAKNRLIASGRNGVDISYDLGKHWQKTNIKPFYTLDISPSGKCLVFAGAKGKVAIKRN